MSFAGILLAIAAGVANPFQAGANAQLYKSFHESVWTALWVYVTGLGGLLLIEAALRYPAPATGDLLEAPWWAWTGGLLSIVPTIVGLAFAQKLGSGVFTGLSVTASILCSVAVDHFGLLGFTVRTASPMRMVGGAVMVLGLWLVSKG